MSIVVGLTRGAGGMRECPFLRAGDQKPPRRFLSPGLPGSPIATNTFPGKLPSQLGVGVMAGAMAECRFVAIMTPVEVLDKRFHRGSRP